MQVRREPKEVQEQKRAAEAEANTARKREQAARNEAKARMKGKNRPTRRHRKKKSNIIEDKKVSSSPGIAFAHATLMLYLHCKHGRRP